MAWSCFVLFSCALSAALAQVGASGLGAYRLPLLLSAFGVVGVARWSYQKWVAPAVSAVTVLRSGELMSFRKGGELFERRLDDLVDVQREGPHAIALLWADGESTRVPTREYSPAAVQKWFENLHLAPNVTLNPPEGVEVTALPQSEQARITEPHWSSPGGITVLIVMALWSFLFDVAWDHGGLWAPAYLFACTFATWRLITHINKASAWQARLTSTALNLQGKDECSIALGDIASTGLNAAGRLEVVTRAGRRIAMPRFSDQAQTLWLLDWIRAGVRRGSPRHARQTKAGSL
jgi:hypothetical protein